MKRKALFISDMPPINGLASSVLFYRHFKLLEESGYEINVLIRELPEKDLVYPSTWKIKILAARKWWYPPYRPHNILKWIRYYILYFEAKAFISEVKPDIIIGFLNGIFYSGLAAFISKKIRKPLAVFYHDRTETLHFRNDSKMQAVTYKHNAYVINQAQLVWTVSPQLVYNNPSWKAKFKIIYPIPEIIKKRAFWKDDFERRPIIGYAGALYNEVVDVMILIGKELQKINGTLLFMTPIRENVMKIKQEIGNIIVADTRDTSEACAYFIENASAFIVAYPENIISMPWIDSCFPSKFTQFVQTGLPLLVLAPEQAAISYWCRNNHWLGYLSNYEKRNIVGLLKKVTQKDSWVAMSNQSIQATENDFNQNKIQSLLEQDVKALVGEN